MLSKGRILSIQSHVAFGYVGNKAAVFPLQCLGYDVDVINTVSYSNHAGYRSFGGTKATRVQLEEIFQGMERNGLLVPQRLLTGFNTTPETLTAVSELVTKLRASEPNLIYVLDPVLGDAGRLYVSADVIPIYRSLLPLATVITPNWYEVQLLTGIELESLNALRTALEILHEDHKVPNVVISSIPLRKWLADVLPPDLKPRGEGVEADAQYLICLSSSAKSVDDVPSGIYARCVPLFSGYFSGVGDLFSALLLAHYHQPSSDDPGPPLDNDETPLSHAASFALSKTHDILRLTNDYSKTLPEEERQPSDDELDAADPTRRTKRMRGRELMLVQGQDILRRTMLAETQKLQPWADFWIRDVAHKSI